MNTTYTRAALSDAVLYEADRRAKSMPIFENSHRGAEANLVGAIGEVIAEQWFFQNGIQFTNETYETTHDYTIGGRFTLDVKTKDRTVLPQPTYDNSVPLYNHEHQRPDYFLFISLVRDKNISNEDLRRFTHACIVGGITYDLANHKGTVFKGGETDPSNGTKFWTSCLNIQMTGLIPVKELIDIWRGRAPQPNSKVSYNSAIL